MPSAWQDLTENWNNAVDWFSFQIKTKHLTITDITYIGLVEEKFESINRVLREIFEKIPKDLPDQTAANLHLSLNDIEGLLFLLRQLTQKTYLDSRNSEPETEPPPSEDVRNNKIQILDFFSAILNHLYKTRSQIKWLIELANTTEYFPEHLDNVPELSEFITFSLNTTIVQIITVSSKIEHEKI